MRQFSKLALITSAVAAIALLIVVASACRYYRIYSFRSWLSYRAMAMECHPVWEDYHFQRINAGDDVEEVIRRTQPERVERDGRWVTLNYQPGGLVFTGVTAYAYDEKMVLAGAWSCAWARLFFDEMTEAQSLEKLGASKSDPRRFGIVSVDR